MGSFAYAGSAQRECRSQPYRILLVISNLEYGGAQRQVIELANNMDAEQFDVHVCSLSGYIPLAEDLHDAGRRLHVINKQWKFDVTVIPRLARLLRGLKADVVHGYLFDAEIATRMAGRLAGTPLIVGSERNTDYTLKRRQLLVYRLTRSCADLVIANSSAGAVFNERMLGHPASMYRVVHNGVNAEQFSPQDSAAVRGALGLAYTDLIIGMFASFKFQKNHPLLFAAFKQVLGRLPEARLLLVGDELYAGMHGSDEYKRQTHRLIDELEIRDRCLFLGNQTDVARLYSVCDVTVLPSLFEGTPNAVLESLACGVPVIATNVSDNAYIIPEGRVGFTVPLGDVETLTERILRILGNSELRQEMRQQARAWVIQEFSTLRLATKTANVYLGALGIGQPKNYPRRDATESAQGLGLG